MTSITKASDITLDEWIAELESGKYTQGHAKLVQSTGEKCCLGVLAHIDDRFTLTGLQNAFLYGFIRMTGKLINRDGTDFIYEGADFFLTPEDQLSLAAINDTLYDNYQLVIIWLKENANRLREQKTTKERKEIKYV